MEEQVYVSHLVFRWFMAEQRRKTTGRLLPEEEHLASDINSNKEIKVSHCPAV